MLLVPNDTMRRGFRTTEFWLCSACSAVLAGIALVCASGASAIAAAIPVSVYCVCRTVIKSRTGVDPAKITAVDERTGL